MIRIKSHASVACSHACQMRGSSSLRLSGLTPIGYATVNNTQDTSCGCLVCITLLQSFLQEPGPSRTQVCIRSQYGRPCKQTNKHNGAWMGTGGHFVFSAQRTIPWEQYSRVYIDKSTLIKNHYGHLLLSVFLRVFCIC